MWMICLPELVSTLSRLFWQKKLVIANYLKLKGSAIADIDVCQITPDVLASVHALLKSGPLRVMDAIHVGCALVVEPDIFVSVGKRKLAAARKTVLKIADVS